LPTREYHLLQRGEESHLIYPSGANHIIGTISGSMILTFGEFRWEATANVLACDGIMDHLRRPYPHFIESALPILGIVSAASPR